MDKLYYEIQNMLLGIWVSRNSKIQYIYRFDVLTKTIDSVWQSKPYNATQSTVLSKYF
jgi:hypothetical protein